MRARLTIVLLALFVVCDVALVTLSFRHTSASSPQAVPLDTPSASRSHTPSAPSVPTSAPKSGGRSQSHALPTGAPVYLTLGADGRALLASRGDCDTREAPRVMVTEREGSSFRSRPVDGLTEVLRVTAQNDGSMWLIGRTENCTVGRWTSSNAGRSWRPTDGPGAEWYLAPSPTQQAVFAPGGRRRSPPCVPLSVSPVDATVARLLCDGGAAMGTSDGGVSWVQLGRLNGAVSFEFSTPGDGVAIAVLRGCPAAVMITSDGGAQWSQMACLEGDEPRAISRAGDHLVAVVGQQTAVSTDGGKTWSAD